MARALGEKEEIVDMIGRKCLGLLACHVTQNEYQTILECFDQYATGNLAPLHFGKLSMKSLSFAADLSA
ncbi:hypothetical protein BBta_1230 [Bradyrhizobium sp. BTAi1]|nr:hypothetical protein BBta_1230 [Bradyrhizobium sp. BTAi1]